MFTAACFATKEPISDIPFPPARGGFQAITTPHQRLPRLARTCHLSHRQRVLSVDRSMPFVTMQEVSDSLPGTAILPPDGMHHQQLHPAFTALCPVELIVDSVIDDEDVDRVSFDADGLTITISNPKRMSMDHYYLAQQPHLPGYEALSELKVQQTSQSEASTQPQPEVFVKPRPAAVQPREDEGQETLPPYSSDLCLENVFMRKMELESVVRRADDRNWNRVFVTLQGTALTFHKYKTTGVFGARPEFLDDFPDQPVEGKKGEFLQSYNLHHADVGIAADYTKKSHVIRIRAESDQFILSCQRIETFVYWLQALSTAIDLALPLDERELPRDYSVPRHQRRVQTSPQSTSAIDGREMLLRDQNEARARLRGMPSTESINTIEPISARSAPRVSNPVTVPRKRQPQPSISPETGKWQPDHGWSVRKDMIYAKHCMAILLSRSPRKSNLIVVKGKQWKVDWATGQLSSCEPPNYEEIDERLSTGSSRRGKNVLRA